MKVRSAVTNNTVKKKLSGLCVLDFFCGFVLDGNSLIDVTRSVTNRFGKCKCDGSRAVAFVEEAA